MKRYAIYFAIVPLVFLSGCASESLFFATKSSIGIDASAAGGAPQANIGYDRTEIAFVPPKNDGSAHAVLGGIDADLSLMDVRIKELFATGKAADNAARKANGKSPSQVENRENQATRATATEKRHKPIVFGTNASLGLLNIQTGGGTPGFGSMLYRRSEATLIPVKPDQDEVASVYADISIDTMTNNESKPDTEISWIERAVGQYPTRHAKTFFGVRIVQSFATGTAAEEIVQRSDIAQKLNTFSKGAPGHTEITTEKTMNALVTQLNGVQDASEINRFFGWIYGEYPGSKANEFKGGKAGDYFSKIIQPRLSVADQLVVNDKAKKMLK